MTSQVEAAFLLESHCALCLLVLTFYKNTHIHTHTHVHSSLCQRQDKNPCVSSRGDGGSPLAIV